MGKKAHIVAINAASIGELGFGISNHPGDVAAVLGGEVWIGPRPVLEENSDFVQPIPYITVRKGGKLLTYVRGGGGGEGRLHGKLAVGFGGHVDAEDIVIRGDGVIDLVGTMAVAMSRELQEELGVIISPETLRTSTGAQWSHAIHSIDTPVDAVHIGLVATLDLDKMPGLAKFDYEADIENAKFMTPAEIKAAGLDLETWTRLVVNLEIDALASAA